MHAGYRQEERASAVCLVQSELVLVASEQIQSPCIAKKDNPGRSGE